MSFSFNCLIHGENPPRLFTVEIEKTKNVSTLEKLIKKEEASFLKDVDASDFEIWMVNVDLHLDELGAEPVYVNPDIDVINLSSSRMELSFLFGDIVKPDCLHIIAKAFGTLLQSFSWDPY